MMIVLGIPRASNTSAAKLYIVRLANLILLHQYNNVDFSLLNRCLDSVIVIVLC